MATPLDTFRALVAADGTLRAELAAAEGQDAFLAAAGAIARRHGLALQPADLAPLTAYDALDMAQREVPPLRCEGWPPPGWLPWRLAPVPNHDPAVDWADFGGVPLDGRFFKEAVRAALARPLNRLLRCRADLQDVLSGPPEGFRAPDGFIFHMSRCGSTLVARMLAALPDSYAINEAGAIDTILQVSATAPEEVRAGALRAMVGALGRRPSRRWFVKLSVWPTLDLALFRKAFPDVPWIFIHRDPAAVLASQIRRRAPELDPRLVPSRLYGIADGTALSGEVYCAMALARVCEAALAAEGGLFVDHADLPEAFSSAILPHFGVDAQEGDAATLRELPRWHAKKPGQPYHGDAPVTDPAIRAAVDAHLAAIYARLRAVRG